MELSNAANLDKLIQSFEYENQQYVKCIERENQHIEAIEKEMEVRKDETERLQEHISQLDEDTKRAHKQFRINRDNVESLKKTTVVLKEHEVALEKTFQSLVEKNNQTRKERSEMIQHYTDIWKDYETKYNSFPLAEELMKKTKKVENLQNQLNSKEEEIQSLQKLINDVKGNSEVNFRDMKKLIIKIVELKTSTDKMCEDIRHLNRENKSIREEIKLAEKKRADRMAKIENEKAIEPMETEEKEKTVKNDAMETSTLISMIDDSDETVQSIIPVAQNQTHLQEQTQNTSSQPSFEEQFARLNQISQARRSTVGSSKIGTPQPQSSVTNVQRPATATISPRQVQLEILPDTQISEKPKQISRPPVMSVPQILEPKISPMHTNMAPPLTTPTYRSAIPTIRTPQLSRMSSPQVLPQHQMKLTRPPTPQVPKHITVTPQVMPRIIETPKMPPQSPQITQPQFKVSRPPSIVTNSICNQEPVKNIPSSKGTDKQAYQQFEARSQYASETSEKEQQLTDESPKSPYYANKSPKTPKTPESNTVDNDMGDYSPFDMEKHKQRLNLLKKSPGQPAMERRPMYTAEKVKATNDSESGVFTGMTTFNLFDSKSNKGNRNTSNQMDYDGLATELSMFSSGNSPSVSEKTPGSSDKPKASNFFDSKSPDLGFGSGFSFGGGGEGGSIMSLFGNNNDDQSKGEAESESSFMSFFGSSDNQGGGDKSGSSIMSLFGDSKEDETQETSFSFSFGGGNNDTPSRGFSLF